jgi:hypothetical protein
MREVHQSAIVVLRCPGFEAQRAGVEIELASLDREDFTLCMRQP